MYGELSGLQQAFTDKMNCPTSMLDKGESPAYEAEKIKEQASDLKMKQMKACMIIASAKNGWQQWSFKFLSFPAR